MRRMGGRYRDTEVRALVEEYGTRLGDRDTTERGLRTLIAVCDLKRAWARLSLQERDIILVLGILAMPQREAGEYFEKSATWVGKEYRTALSNLTYEMNGGMDVR